MQRIVATLVLTTFACGVGAVPLRAAEADTKLGRQAYAFVQKYCAGCHHGDKPKSEVKDYDVLSYASLIMKRKVEDEDRYFIKPGTKGEKALKESVLWQEVGVEKEMPPKEFEKKEVKPQPSDKEREILKRWIEAGAPKEGFGPADKKEGSRRDPRPSGRGLLRAALLR
jgi:hypothetical protein